MVQSKEVLEREEAANVGTLPMEQALPRGKKLHNPLLEAAVSCLAWVGCLIRKCEWHEKCKSKKTAKLSLDRLRLSLPKILWTICPSFPNSVILLSQCEDIE